MKILIACECSGEVRRAFRALGHDAWSCDLKPSEDNSPFHIIGDALQIIKGGGWDLIIMHPPCTFLSLSGIHWNSRRPERAKQTEEALQFVRDLIAACGDTPWVIENPMSIISTHIRRMDHYIQPYQFGHDASKTTWLWLHRVPRLRIDPQLYVHPRWVCPACNRTLRHPEAAAWIDQKGYHRCPVDNTKMKARWANQTDSGQNRLAPSATRATDRARTYPGIARAMAEQWGRLK